MFLPSFSQRRCEVCERKVTFRHDVVIHDQCTCVGKRRWKCFTVENLTLSIFSFLLFCFLGATTVLMYVSSSYAFNEASRIAVDQHVKYHQNLNSDIQLLRIADFDSNDQ